jgi:hypothetical protein
VGSTRQFGRALARGSAGLVAEGGVYEIAPLWRNVIVAAGISMD